MSFLIFFLLSCLKIAVVLAIFLGAVAYTVLLERKLVGRIQNRWGPSRVGPFGMWQPMADGLKLFLKEDLLAHQRRPAALHSGAHDRARLRLDLDFRSTLRRPHHLARRRHVRDRQREYRTAGDSRRHLGRGLRNRPGRLVVQQQIFAPGSPARQCPGRSATSLPWDFRW